MTLDTAGVLDVLVSHAQEIGCFERVMGHEPKNAPGNGLTCAFWVAQIAPIQSSGLSKTSVRLEITARIFISMMAEPYDGIDINALNAVDILLRAYSGDFEMAGLAREIDLLGEFGEGLNARGGYVTIDQKPLRAMNITIPVIIDDIWDQSP